jgi:2-oxoisovalerate dehydrogenase E2 component (dihydrolipoyl transacylase)
VSQFVFKLPDLGEGTVEAEIVGWRVKPGDLVSEDDVIVEVMTEKAAVELPSPVTGRVVSTTGGPGDMVPVGAALIVLEMQAADTPAAKPGAQPAAPITGKGSADGAPAVPATGSQNKGTGPRSPVAALSGNGAGVAHSNVERNGRVATSPAIRRRAHEAGIDLRQVAGSGPNGRIVRADLNAYAERQAGSHAAQGKVAGRGATQGLESPTALRPRTVDGATEEIKVIGLRRLIAQRMSEAKRNIPHFAYVEEMDVTELEALRRHLNGRLAPGTAALTYLPFLVLGLVRVLRDFPQGNALYDAERGVIIRHHAVHVGVATQTPEGLKVPVVRDAQSRSLWDLAAEMRRVTEAARTNKATRDELSGSTITVTSLGKLGGIASTPIINAPEVAIIGVNRAVERPVVLNGGITIRRMMNLSSSFDHRFVDGYDAAAMIQALKEYIEHPATLFIGT